MQWIWWLGLLQVSLCVVLFDFLYKYTTDTPSKRNIVNAYNFNYGVVLFDFFYTNIPLIHHQKGIL